MLSRIPRAASLRTGPLRANLTTSAPRLSAAALGKRPAVPPRSGLQPGVLNIPGARHFTWQPWKTAASNSASTDGLEEVASSTPDPLVAAPHPDLPNALPTESVAVSASDISTSIPALPSAATTDPTLLPQSPALPEIPTLEELVTKSGMSLSEVLHSPQAAHATMKASDLSLLGLDHSALSISGWLQEALVSGHVITGLPWWGTIAAVTVAVRCCLLPLIVRMTRHNVRLAAVQPQMSALFKRLQDEKKNNNPQGQQVVMQTLQKLMKEHDVSPFRPLLMPLVQMPFFLGFFYALRGLAGLPLPQLREGGFGWVTDLTMPDPYYILPITSMLFTNLVLRVGADGTAAMNANNNMGHFRNALTIMSIVAIPFIGRMPAAVLFYWTFSNLFSLTQAFLLRQPRVKALLRIPPAPKPEPLPAGVEPPKEPTYRDTWDALRKHLGTRGEAWQQAKAGQQALLAQKERADGKKAGSALLMERVREKAPEPVVASMAESASSVASASVPSWSEDAGVRSPKEEAKARRVAAARERRARH